MSSFAIFSVTRTSLGKRASLLLRYTSAVAIVVSQNGNISPNKRLSLVHYILSVLILVSLTVCC